jgi:hypothetical protein
VRGRENRKKRKMPEEKKFGERPDLLFFDALEIKKF